MLKKLLLYGNTIKRMKPGQIQARIRKTLGLKNTIGKKPAEWYGQFFAFQSIEELDFDPVFLSRFDADEFEKGNVTFLHESEKIDWNGKWEVPARSALWNFNLHYFEYLMPYIKAYKTTQDAKYLKAIKTCIDGWIAQNPVQSGGDGCAPYTISLRLVYWFSCLFYLSSQLDEEFRKRMIASAYEQYVYLSVHLEKDLLANHYFEDLKTLILSSLFFQDEKMLQKSLTAFKQECKEQILPDGMHFELSPMYHKIILEDILRISIALRRAHKEDAELEQYIKPMLDAAYTFEEGLERIPLFNDGGDNVAKSLAALVQTANHYYAITPERKSQLPDSGYYFFQWNDWRLIVDAGTTGPKYNAGHAHCDAMSFELFYKGIPVLVNCGTYAYQCKERFFFRSTAAHNTVMAHNTEQSECWGAFRVGREAKVKVAKISKYSIEIDMSDQKGHIIHRLIKIGDNHLFIEDKISNGELKSYLHLNRNTFEKIGPSFTSTGIKTIMQQEYAPEYGAKQTISTLMLTGETKTAFDLNLQELEMIIVNTQGRTA